MPPKRPTPAGAAYLIYGGSNLAGLRQTVNNVPYISLGNVAGGTGDPNNVPGAVITGPAGSSQTGFSVAAGGDFNGDGYRGHPGRNARLREQLDTAGPRRSNPPVRAPSSSGAYLTGLIPLGAIPTNIDAAPVRRVRRRRRGRLCRVCRSA